MTFNTRLKSCFNGLILSIFVLLSWQGVAVAAIQVDKPLVFGVYAYIEEDKVRAEYQPLIDYLNQQLGAGSVEMQVLPLAAFNDTLINRYVDIATTNPTHFLQLRYKYNLTGALATRVRKSDNQPLSMLGGIVFSKSNRKDINRLVDIQDKSIAIASQQHLGGYWAQLYECRKAGFDVQDDQLVIAGSHQKAIEAVIAGKADVGFARTGIFELMLAQGSVAANDIKVINAQYTPGFANKISTEIYPEWPVFALNPDNTRIKEVIRALLAYHPALEQVEEGGVIGYDLPADYMKIEALAREMRLPPFDFAPSFSLSDAWQKWQDLGWLLIVFFSVLLSLLFVVAVMYRRAQRERYRNQLLLSSLGEGVFGVNNAERCTFINAVALQMLGYKESEVLGRHQHAVFHYHHPDGRVFDRADCPVLQTLQDGQVRTLETHFIRADGRVFPARLNVAPMLEMSKVIGAEVIFQDITQQKEAEAKLYQLANFDGLTELVNRRYFMEQLSVYFERGNAPMVLLMLDLDHFKQINDTYGHAIGDAVLQVFSRILLDKLSSFGVAGRIGGEEFAVLLPQSNLAKAKLWAERLREAVALMRVPYLDGEVSVTISIGVAEFESALKTIDDWLSNADKALYCAKHSGRNKVCVL